MMLSKTKEYRNAYQKEWLAKNPGKMRGRNLTRYWPDMTMEGAGLQYEQLRRGQNGLCAICKTAPLKVLNVDHCHTTGKVRGLLCSACNRGLGFFRENKEALLNAVVYLEKSREFTLTSEMNNALTNAISLSRTNTWSDAIASAADRTEWASKSEKGQFIAWATKTLQVKE